MAPWPDQKFPHVDCGGHIRDLLLEMVPNEVKVTPEFKAALAQLPGGAVTCPYCQRAVEYKPDGQTLTVSLLAPLRYSRMKTELRAKDYGSQKNPPNHAITPEAWVAEEKLMPGALQGYTYWEDRVP